MHCLLLHLLPFLWWSCKSQVREIFLDSPLCYKQFSHLWPSVITLVPTRSSSRPSIQDLLIYMELNNRAYAPQAWLDSIVVMIFSFNDTVIKIIWLSFSSVFRLKSQACLIPPYPPCEQPASDWWIGKPKYRWIEHSSDGMILFCQLG